LNGVCWPGPGRYTRLEVTEQPGIPLDHARRLWRAVGFPETDDDQRVSSPPTSPPWPTPPGCSPRECSTPTAWSSWLARSATCCPASPRPRRVSSPTSSGHASRPDTSPRIPRRANTWRTQAVSSPRSCCRCWNAPPYMCGGGIWPPKRAGHCCPQPLADSADSAEFTFAARAPRRVRGYLQLRTYGCAEPSPRCLPPPHDRGRWRGGVNPAELVPAVVSDQAR